TSDSATRASRRVFRAFSEPSPVAIRMRSPSRPTHTGAICGDPSAMSVARWAKFGASSSRLTSSDRVMDSLRALSAPPEDRRALLEEGAARLAGVLAGERAADVGQLVAEMVLEVDGGGARDPALGQAIGERGPLGQQRAVLGEPRLQPVVVDDLADEAEPQRLVGVDRAVLEQEPQGLLVTDGL